MILLIVLHTLAKWSVIFFAVAFTLRVVTSTALSIHQLAMKRRGE